MEGHGASGRRGREGSSSRPATETAAAPGETVEVPVRVADPLLNLCLETVDREKQTLVFCNTKRGAESQAERIAKQLRHGPAAARRHEELAEQALGVLSQPTKQCKRLALCLRHGVAFHHAGLHSAQRDLIEEAFRKNEISIICSTPTLAMGLDLPAFRSVIRDVKRFNSGSGWGLSYIPVLEYEQMAGRAGRPGKEEWGEAILIAETAAEAEELREKYVLGQPEEIYSKLAVEPVLRTYILSLIATGFIRNREGMYRFFDKTFHAAQYLDLAKLHGTLDKMLLLLEEWEFITVLDGDRPRNPEKRNPFQSADELVAMGTGERFRPTPLGVRVAQLYLDPYTAAFLIKHLRKATGGGMTGAGGGGGGGREGGLDDFALLHLLASTLEMRPLLRPRTKDYDVIEQKLILVEDDLLVAEPNRFGYDYEEFLAAVKTAMFFEEWIEETLEEELLEKYGIRPGEIQTKLDRADWLLYACEELCKILAFHTFLPQLARMRIRLEYGVKADLLNLLRLKGIGKVRARLLYRNGIKSVGDVKTAELSTLAQLLGSKTAANVKEQVGQTVNPNQLRVRPGKRRGQKSLGDWNG